MLCSMNLAGWPKCHHGSSCKVIDMDQREGCDSSLEDNRTRHGWKYGLPLEDYAEWGCISPSLSVQKAGLHRTEHSPELGGFLALYIKKYHPFAILFLGKCEHLHITVARCLQVSSRLRPHAPLLGFSMASAQPFDIEPIARFNGASAGIRRPKVCPCGSDRN